MAETQNDDKPNIEEVQKEEGIIGDFLGGAQDKFTRTSGGTARNTKRHREKHKHTHTHRCNIQCY